jgi:hypothetical protein
MASSFLRAALYARVSTDQKAKANTIDSQLDAIRSRVAQDGLVLGPNDSTPSRYRSKGPEPFTAQASATTTPAWPSGGPRPPRASACARPRSVPLRPPACPSA